MTVLASNAEVSREDGGTEVVELAAEGAFMMWCPSEYQIEFQNKTKTRRHSTHLTSPTSSASKALAACRSRFKILCVRREQTANDFV